MISVKPWKWEAVGRFALGVLGILFTGILLNTLVVSLFPGLSEDARRLMMAIMTLVLEAGILAWVGFFLWESDLSVDQAFGFFSNNAGRAVAVGVTAGVLALPFAWGVQELSLAVLKWLQIESSAQLVVQELQNPDLSLLQKILFGIVAIIAAPVAEECVFRGILYPTIKQAGYPKLALLGTSILFGASHANAPSFLPLTCLGLLLIFLYEKTDNLLAPIVTHSVFNGVNFLLLIFMEPQ